MKIDYSEKRKYARLDIALTVGYSVLDPNGKTTDSVESYSGDISAGGLRLMTPSNLKNGTKLNLEVYLGDDIEKPLFAKGEVVWQNEITETSFETGVIITDMSRGDKDKLVNFVEDQMSHLIQTIH